MAIFCIPKHLVERLKASALRQEVDIKALYEMTSAQRREFFANHTDGELGKFINAKFEEAMVSKQKNALTDWAKSVFTPEAKAKPVYNTILKKINTLDELGVLSPKTEDAFLENLVADKLGISVSAEEVKEISDRAQKIRAAQEKLGNDLGIPSKEKETTDFLLARKEMDDYLASKNPSSRLKVLTGTIGRGMMLFSVKSPLLNIGSNIEIGLAETIGRRIASGRISGADPKLAADYIKMANRIYKKTGYDITRMTNIEDTGASGSRVLDDIVTTQGPGLIRKTGRIVEDIVFKNLMGAPDVAFASLHFADSLNINAMRIAEGNKSRAKEVMLDAIRLVPQTAEGEILRTQAILDSQVATWTNDSWASKTSLGIRKILNDMSGNWRVGDFVMPFVRTPANVIATGMDYSGLGALRGAVEITEALRQGKEIHQDSFRGLARSGLGLTGAAILAANLDDDDFVGPYDPRRQQIETLRNSSSNSFRIGGKWISTAWLGPLAIPFTAMMHARKYGKKGAPEAIFQFGSGVISQIGDLPGISEVSDYVKSRSYKKDQGLAEAGQEAIGSAIKEASSRLIPSFVSDVSKTVDPYERKAKTAIESSMAKIPIAREGLPIKRDIFGDAIETEKGALPILFGSRVKTDKETPFIKEILRVSDAVDKSISFTDWDKTSSKRIGQLKEKIGEEKFEKAKILYGKMLKKGLILTINGEKYQGMNDTEKYRELSKIDTEVVDLFLKAYEIKK